MQHAANPVDGVIAPPEVQPPAKIKDNGGQPEGNDGDRASIHYLPGGTNYIIVTQPRELRQEVMNVVLLYGPG